ncbi:MAG: helix-turn-helix domain-containing protein [Gammaproteobacteria bacterium]|nr:helix-turn-helix domain-containing protein [Gammaproteobacteria bacterium]
MSDLHDEEIAIQEPTPSVGEQLKLAREAKKMTVGEIAAQLRLTQQIINNLETEQWEALHGRPYARGYFVSYVKFLGLPEHEMLAAFNLDYKTTDASASTSRTFEPKRASFPWLQILLVIAVIVATWFAYQQWQRSQSSSAASDAVSTFKSDAVSTFNQFLQEQNNSGFASSVVEPLSNPKQKDVAQSPAFEQATESLNKEPELQ